MEKGHSSLTDKLLNDATTINKEHSNTSSRLERETPNINENFLVPHDYRFSHAPRRLDIPPQNRKLSNISSVASEAKILYPYRFLVLGCFILTSCANGFSQFAYAPISVVLESLYGISPLATTTIVLIYYAGFLFFAPPFTYIMDKKGIGVPIVAAATMTLVGGWIRYLVVPTGNYYWITVGTLFSAIG